MDYVHTYPDEYIRFHTSDMILSIDSDTDYLIAPKLRSRVVGYFYLSSKPTDKEIPTLNGTIHVECKIFRHVVSSAAEVEVGDIFHHAQAALPI